MASATPSSFCNLLVDDQGGWLRTVEGRLLGSLPDLPPSPAKRQAWAEGLRALLPRGTQLRLILAHPNLTIQCQDVPFLSPKDVLDVGSRLAAAEGAGDALSWAATLDADPVAENGHVLWMAAHPREEMDDWMAAIQGAGHALAFATPYQRILLQLMEGLEDLPPDRMVLVAEPGQHGHLLIFRGRSLMVNRSFGLPPDPEERDEVIYEELSRLLQFLKQKHRHLAFNLLCIAGMPSVSPALSGRLQGNLRLATRVLPGDLWSQLEEGIQREQGRKHALNLVPLEVREAARRKVFRTAIILMGTLLAGLFLGVTLLMGLLEARLAREVQRTERVLAEKQARTAADEEHGKARLPLLRVRLAEHRQGEAIRGLDALVRRIFEVPDGLQLEQVEILELPGEKVAHRFSIRGLALTDRTYSVGPLALYLDALRRESGLLLAPVREVQVSDRILEGGALKVEQRAVTRFHLEGIGP